jgi:hypothetical protein
MRRREFVQSIARSMTNAVSYPDHPLLVSAPDILAIVDGRLTAFFLRNEDASANLSRDEISRILLGRLALPPDTRFGLMVAGDVEVNPTYLQLLDGVQYGMEGRHPTTANWEPSYSPLPEILNRLRSSHNARFADAWPASSSVSTRQPTRDSGDPTSVRRALPRRIPQWAELDNGVIYANLKESRDRTELVRSVRQLNALSVEIDYGFDRGLDALFNVAAEISGHRAHLATHHATVTLPQTTRAWDVLKPLRAAAFAGISVQTNGDNQ